MILVNVLAFVWEFTTGATHSTAALLDDGAFYGPAVAQGEYWRFLTSAFLHGNLMHIIFNMLMLYQVGTFVESIYGSTRMGIVYFFAALGGGAAVYSFNFNSVTLGASGALFGLLGALCAVGLRLGDRGRGLIKQTAPIVAINLALGYFLPNISIAAHVGGLLFGFIAGFVLFSKAMLPEAVAADEGLLYAASQARPSNTAAAGTIEGEVLEERSRIIQPHEPPRPSA